MKCKPIEPEEMRKRVESDVGEEVLRVLALSFISRNLSWAMTLFVDVGMSQSIEHLQESNRSTVRNPNDGIEFVQISMEQSC